MSQLTVSKKRILRLTAFITMLCALILGARYWRYSLSVRHARALETVVASTSWIELRHDPRPQQSKRGKSRQPSGSSPPLAELPVDSEGQSLFEALRSKRLELARDQGIPPYVIFHDRTLVEMVLRRPSSLAEMLQVPGVGDAKLAKYGEVFLAVLGGTTNAPRCEGL